MFKVAICDDTPEYRLSTKALLEEWAAARSVSLLIDCFDDGDALLSALSRRSYDVILLDVIMPMLSGIDTCMEIRKENRQTRIVFLSVSPEFGVDAFRVRANNYLLKPLNHDRLYELMDEYAAETTGSEHFIMAKTANMVQKVPIHSISHLEAQDKHVLLFTNSDDVLSITTPLNQLSKVLNIPCFFQCHRSYIVNMNHIRTCTKNTLTMHSGHTIPISRNCAKEFQETYFSFLFGKAGDP